MQFFDGTGWKTISPDNVIRSVPYSAYSYSAEKLGTKGLSDLVVKTDINSNVSCGGGSSFLTWDATTQTFGCSGVAGAAGGTVTSVTSSNSYLSIVNNTSTPTLTLNVGTAAGTVAAGNDSRLVNALQIGASASGDLAGNYPGPTVTAIQGVAVSATAPTSGQFFKYNGTNWAGSAIAISDVTNLSTQLSSYLTQSAFNTYVSAANCAANETMYWNSVTSNFSCKTINVGLAGDVTGSIGASKVVALQNKNIAATAPTNGQVLQWNGTTTQWEPTTLPAGNYVTALTGDVTATGPGSVAATVAKLQGSTLTITTPANKDYLKFNGTAFVNSPLAAADLSGTVPAANMPAFTGDVTSSAGSTTLTLANSGVTAGTYKSVSVDTKGRVTGGSNPTNLSGYGITDAISNAGGTPSIQTGLDSAKPVSPAAGAIYFATDSKVIYQFNSGTWISIASATGSGGTITGVTAGTGLSGGGSTGSVALNLANTTVTAGSYTRANITVDAQGRLTSAANGANINLASEVTGTLPIANGGTGASTALGAFNLLSPLTTKGDLLTRDGTNNIRLAVGTNGQVLSADSTQASGLKWITPPSGTVTNVTGTLPVVVATGSTTPAISVNAATTSSQGVVQVGAGIAVSAGTISADPTNFPSLVPISKGGTGTNTITANGLVAANGTGSAYTSFACGVGQVITFNASGVAACTTYTAAGFFLNGGNSFGGAATLGTNDANSLGFKTNNSVAMTIDSSGKVGLGTTSPSSRLHVFQSVDTVAGALSITNTGNTATTALYVDASANTHLGGSTASPNALVIQNSTGNIGLGTTSPGTTLDVNGGFRPGSQTVVTTCGAAQEGVQRYNNSSHFMEYCNGTTWVAYTAASSTLSKVDFFGDGSGKALYQFDGNANDTSGTYNGTPTNVIYTAGPFGLAAQFNGSNAYMSASTFAMSNSQPFSVSLWVRANGALSSGKGFMGIGQVGTGAKALTTYWYNNTGEIAIDQWGGPTYTTGIQIAQAPFTHMVYVFSGGSTTGPSTIAIYVNGIATTLTSLRTGPSLSLAGSSLYLGSIDSTTTYNSNVIIDQVRVFNRALNQTEAIQLYNEK